MDEEFILVDEEGKERLVIIDVIEAWGEKYVLAKAEDEDIFFVLKEKGDKYVGIEDEEEYEAVKDICRDYLDRRAVTPDEEE